MTQHSVDADSVALTILIKHPSMNPTGISEAISLEPTLLQAAGEPITTPKGNAPGGVYNYSTWQRSAPISDSDAARKEVEALAKHLSSNSSAIANLVDAGCSIDIFFRGTNCSYLSLMVQSTILEIFASLGASFGFEFLAPDRSNADRDA